MKALHEMGVAELGRALDAKEVSSVEATKHLLDRLAGHAELNAVLATDPQALEQATAADTRRAAGERVCRGARREPIVRPPKRSCRRSGPPLAPQGTLRWARSP